MPHPLGDELTELHVHLGGAVDPAAMWGIAHEQGIRLPTKDYWEFVDLITVRKQTKKSFEDFLALSQGEHHHARAALQPDETQPRRRA